MDELLCRVLYVRMDSCWLLFRRTKGGVLDGRDENCRPEGEEGDRSRSDNQDILKRSLKKSADLSSYKATPTTSRKRPRNLNSSSGPASQETSLSGKSKKRLRFTGPDVDDDVSRKLENDLLESAFETPADNSRRPVVVLSPEDVKPCDKLLRKWVAIFALADRNNS